MAKCVVCDHEIDLDLDEIRLDRDGGVYHIECYDDMVDSARDGYAERKEEDEND